MNITRDVVMDLLPLYIAGEASADTRALVDAYLAQDPALASRVRDESAAFHDAAPAVPPDLQLRTLQRTRSLIARQRWLFGAAICFTVAGTSSEMSLARGHQGFHFLVQDFPIPLGVSLILAVIFWVAYYRLHKQLRSAV